MKKYIGFLLPAAAFRLRYGRTAAFFATVLLLATGLAPAASSADELDDGDLISQAEKVTPAAAKFISNVEFERMVKSNALKLSTPGEIFSQVLQAQMPMPETARSSTDSSTKTRTLRISHVWST